MGGAGVITIILTHAVLFGLGMVVGSIWNDINPRSDESIAFGFAILVGSGLLLIGMKLASL